MIHIGAWVWGNKYAPHYIDRLRAGIWRHMQEKRRFHVWAPSPEDLHLTKIQGCFARLRTFDPDWQAQQGIERGDRIVVLDLDLIVTGPLDELFCSDDPFTILQGINATNPCPYNGSVWCLRAGYRPDVQSEFTLEKARAAPHYAFPDDQAWLAHTLPGAASFGPHNGVYGFQKRGWPTGNTLPMGAKIVAFPGHRDPAQFIHLPWVRDHWRT